MTIYIDENTIEKVKEAGEIVSIVSDYLPLKRSGANYVGLCPFHNEKTPSFTVSDSKQIFHCFGCNEGGDALKFIMKMENLGFPEAVKFLADKLGIPIEETGIQNKELIQEKNRGYDINKEAARYFFTSLTRDREALEYLYKRGFNKQIIKRFGLGYAHDRWDGLYKHLLNAGYKEEEMKKFGLINQSNKTNGYYDKFRHRIIFPIIDIRARVVGFGGRVLDDQMPKYLNSQETPVFHKGNALYGLNLVDKLSDKKRIILVEGYMDVLSIANKGINYSVASLGTALTEGQAKLLKRYGDTVYICFDSDQAGISATNRAIDILEKLEVEAKIISLGKYKDPDDFLKENSLTSFEQKIEEALNPIDFWIGLNRQKYNIEDAEARIKFTIEVSKIIKRLKSPIEKDVYIDKIAKDTNISKEAIEREVFGNNVKSGKKAHYKEKLTIAPVRTILPTASLRAEIDLIKLMIFNKNYFDIISLDIGPEDYRNPQCGQIFKLIKRTYMEEDELDEELLRKKLLERENIDDKLIIEIFEEKLNFTPENIQQIIRDLINTLKTDKLVSHRNQIRRQIEEFEKQKDLNPMEEERFLELCMELTNLNKELSLIRNEDGR